MMTLARTHAAWARTCKTGRPLTRRAAPLLRWRRDCRAAQDPRGGGTRTAHHRARLPRSCACCRTPTHAVHVYLHPDAPDRRGFGERHSPSFWRPPRIVKRDFQFGLPCTARAVRLTDMSVVPASTPPGLDTTHQQGGGYPRAETVREKGRGALDFLFCGACSRENKPCAAQTRVDR